MMKTYEFTIISHREPGIEDTLTGDDSGICSDHAIGVSGFTADIQAGKNRAQHRFGIIILTDPNTAHDMALPEKVAVEVICGILNRMKDMLDGIFGSEIVQLAILQDMVTTLGDLGESWVDQVEGNKYPSDASENNPAENSPLN